MLYPTHSIGGVLGALPAHAVSVSALGVVDQRGDGVFDRSVSQFDNDFSNASALFELSDGGIMRINEMRRVGYPSHIRESRFRFFGTEASFEQLATVSVLAGQAGRHPDLRPDRLAALDVAGRPVAGPRRPRAAGRFLSGHAAVHEVSRLPDAFRGVPTGHEGSHHFLVDDFARAVETGTLPPVNAWAAARFTVPGIIAHQSTRQGGARLHVPDFGDAPA